MRIFSDDIWRAILIGFVAAAVACVFSLAMRTGSKGAAIAFGFLVGAVVAGVALVAFGFENTGAP